MNLSRATWQKSNRSSGQGNCVEIAHLDDDTVAIRDSKNPTGPALRFTPAEFAAFLNATKHGEFDHLLD